MPKTLFEHFDHKCELTKYATGRQKLMRVFKWFNLYYWFSMQETDRNGYIFLRSYKRIQQEQKKHSLHPYIIHPFSKFSKIWEIIWSFILLLQCYMISFDLALCTAGILTEKLTAYLWCRLVVDMLCIFDIALTFLKGYCVYKNSVIITQPSRIMKHYLKGSFAFDLFCSLPIYPLYFLISGNHIDMSTRMWFAINYVSTVKLVRYAYVIKLYWNWTDEWKTPYQIRMLLLGLILFASYIHTICCFQLAWSFYLKIWDPELADYDFIIESYGTGAKSLLVLYLRFYYISCLVSCNASTGFNAISNYSLASAVILWAISRTLLFGVITFYLHIYMSINSTFNIHSQIAFQMASFIRKKKIPKSLGQRLYAYFDVSFKQSFYKEQKILNTISSQLRQEIELNTCQNLVKNLPFFKSIPSSLLMRIISSLKYELYLTNDIIVKEGTLGESMYFIAYGTVAVYTKNGKEMCHLYDGDHFGEIALVMKDCLRITTVIAIDVCEVYRFDKKDFIRLLRPYPELIEKIILIASERAEHTDTVDKLTKTLKPIKMYEL